MTDNKKVTVVMLGATGAVGGEVLKNLISSNSAKKITLLGRRDIKGIAEDYIDQYKINIFDTSSYVEHIKDHDTAICTLGVGEPSKMSKEDFIKIDKTAVIEFAEVCKHSGVKHFELLSSVGINHQSSNFFLRSKGELVEELKALNFDRLSIFQPSMIITPQNRYGVNQALTLALWPIVDKIFFAGLKKFKGIKVEQLGKAIAMNTYRDHHGLEMLTWRDFQRLIK